MMKTIDLVVIEVSNDTQTHGRSRPAARRLDVSLAGNDRGFLRHNMLRVGCLIGPFHTVIDACAEYGLEVEAFYAELADSITASR